MKDLIPALFVTILFVLAGLLFLSDLRPAEARQPCYRPSGGTNEYCPRPAPLNPPYCPPAGG